jgi:hypothetical protein
MARAVIYMALTFCGNLATQITAREKERKRKKERKEGMTL